MICMDMKIGLPAADNRTFWFTIGTVFVANDCKLIGENDKPATFKINYPHVQGIIVLREKKDADKNKKP